MDCELEVLRQLELKLLELRLLEIEPGAVWGLWATAEPCWQLQWSPSCC